MHLGRMEFQARVGDDLPLGLERDSGLSHGPSERRPFGGREQGHGAPGVDLLAGQERGPIAQRGHLARVGGHGPRLDPTGIQHRHKGGTGSKAQPADGAAGGQPSGDGGSGHGVQDANAILVVYGGGPLSVVAQLGEAEAASSRQPRPTTNVLAG